MSDADHRGLTALAFVVLELVEREKDGSDHEFIGLMRLTEVLLAGRKAGKAPGLWVGVVAARGEDYGSFQGIR